MEIVAVILAGVAGMAGGVWGGLRVGERLREQRPWRFWAANGIAFVVALFLLAAAGFTGQLWVWALVISAFAGMLTGLKYGYGKSVGLWRTHDRMMHADKDLRD